MPDYGHDLLFGTFVPPTAERAEEVVRLAEATERAGLDLVSVQDHPYQPAFLDTWTLLSVIAARTSAVRVFPSVANLALRPPAMLARAAASLDILSGGRVELGLGAGGFPEAAAAMGAPLRTPAESVAAMTEAIDVLRALWTPGRRVRLDGAHYPLAGAKPGPLPAHPIGIWLGSLGPRMLRLTGRAADGWVVSSPYVPPERLASMNQVIDDAAGAAGRDPAAVRRVYNVVGSFTGSGQAYFQGRPKVWAEQLAELALAEGISAFVLPVEVGGDGDLARFAEEVAPAVRELVAAERTAGPTGPRSEPRPSSEPPSSEPLPSEPLPSEPRSPAPQAPVRGTGGLGVAPTPDPGERLSETRVWDESTRPRVPRPDPGTVYPDRGRANAQHLVDVHDHFRQELGQLRDLVEQVAGGELDAGAARSAINTMTVRQNRWTLGTYCESYCRAVTMHHTLEDVGMFPQLRRADGQLGPVLDRLHEEHEAIAGVLERVDAALVAVVQDPDGGVEPVRAAVDLLTDTLLSHLAYEERELVEPLARLAAT